jgi:hypothetical protein
MGNRSNDLEPKHRAKLTPAAKTLIDRIVQAVRSGNDTGAVSLYTQIQDSFSAPLDEDMAAREAADERIATAIGEENWEALWAEHMRATWYRCKARANDHKASADERLAARKRSNEIASEAFILGYNLWPTMGN